MKKIKVLYWIFTGLFAFMMAGSAIPDALSSQIATDGFHKMSMPVYLLPFLGIAKLLGVAAILIPRYSRVKEWAYAGLMFDLAGATFCIFASGERGGNLASMVIPIALGVLSYIYYHKKQSVTVQLAVGCIDG